MGKYQCMFSRLLIGPVKQNIDHVRQHNANEVAIPGPIFMGVLAVAAFREARALHRTLVQSEGRL